jgi:hypothetical protein
MMCTLGFHGSHELGFACLVLLDLHLLFYLFIICMAATNDRTNELDHHNLKLRPRFFYNVCDVIFSALNLMMLVISEELEINNLFPHKS